MLAVHVSADGKLSYQITKHADWITAVEFSRDGSRLATADRSGGVYLWEAVSGGVIVSLAQQRIR